MVFIILMLSLSVLGALSYKIKFSFELRIASLKIFEKPPTNSHKLYYNIHNWGGGGGGGGGEGGTAGFILQCILPKYKVSLQSIRARSSAGNHIHPDMTTQKVMTLAICVADIPK